MRTHATYSRKVLEVLKRSPIPMDVENVRSKAGLKNWESTKAILLEMLLQGKISGQKTTKSWVFWAGSIHFKETASTNGRFEYGLADYVQGARKMRPTRSAHLQV